MHVITYNLLHSKDTVRIIQGWIEAHLGDCCLCIWMYSQLESQMTLGDITESLSHQSFVQLNTFCWHWRYWKVIVEKYVLSAKLHSLWIKPQHSGKGMRNMFCNCLLNEPVCSCLCFEKSFSECEVTWGLLHSWWSWQDRVLPLSGRRTPTTQWSDCEPSQESSSPPSPPTGVN